MKLPGIVIILLVLGFAACNLDGPLDVGPVRNAVIYGRVQSADFAGVGSVPLTVKIDPYGQCPATTNHYSRTAALDTVTDANGFYRVTLWMATDIITTCVRVFVTPPITSLLRDTSFSVGPIRLNTRAPLDSVRTDVVLLPRAP